MNSELPTGWEWQRLERLSDAPITYGVVQPGPPDSSASAVPFVRAGDIANGRVLLGQLRTITPEISNRYQRTVLRGGEVVVPLVGNPGEAAVVPAELRRANIARQVGLVRIGDTADANFVTYWLRSRFGRHELAKATIGTAQSVINLRDLKQVQLPWPQTSERRRIAALLRTLDDKIDSNRRLAWLLEETAGVLFRARFVDFVGVDEFEEAEIGRVPKGWGVGTLGDLATTVKHTVKPGDNPEHLFEHFGILDFDAGRRPDVVPGGQLLSGKTLLPDRDCLLVSKLNPATRRVWWARPTGSHTAISSPEFLVLVPRDGVPITYLYSVVGHDEGFYGELLSHVGGTTGSRQRVKPDAALGCRVLVPSTSELEGWDLVVRPLYDRAAATISESATLASVRDALLPKLISGEMRVPDTQDAAEVIKPVVEGLGTFA